MIGPLFEREFPKYKIVYQTLVWWQLEKGKREFRKRNGDEEDGVEDAVEKIFRQSLEKVWKEKEN